MHSDENTAQIEARREMMRVLAHAHTAELDQLLASLRVPEHSDLRKPEVGLVMLRGRIGGDGASFNVGEATVTRAAVRLATGEMGFSYILGRDPRKARQAALVDAMWQSTSRRAEIETKVIAGLRRLHSARMAESAARTAATKVDFFTLVRGEDQ